MHHIKQRYIVYNVYYATLYTLYPFILCSKNPGIAVCRFYESKNVAYYTYNTLYTSLL